MSIDRRTFLRQASGAAAGCAVGALVPELTPDAHAEAAAAAPVAAPADPGKLVRVTHPGTVKGGKILVGDKARALVRRALTEFTGEADPVKALGRYVTKDDVVGLKVNCLGSPGAATHPDITFAVVEM